jgi:hypothetical protein
MVQEETSHHPRTWHLIAHIYLLRLCPFCNLSRSYLYALPGHTKFGTTILIGEIGSKLKLLSDGHKMYRVARATLDPNGHLWQREQFGETDTFCGPTKKTKAKKTKTDTFCVRNTPSR